MLDYDGIRRMRLALTQEAQRLHEEARTSGERKVGVGADIGLNYVVDRHAVAIRAHHHAICAVACEVAEHALFKVLVAQSAYLDDKRAEEAIHD